MNNTLYLSRNKDLDERLKELIHLYGLLLCYDDKHEKVLKGNSILLSLKKKYVFLRVFSDGSATLMHEIKNLLLN